ncbi:hypothetical protein Syun_030147 [Stephania yunnanensis]|uniref:Uncharacterized protein n=1 Tax=Stephania yunnanensis TaxID=152371 RepID=A0AAP0E9Z9_9MAGN
MVEEPAKVVKLTKELLGVELVAFQVVVVAAASVLLEVEVDISRVQSAEAKEPAKLVDLAEELLGVE